jgi:hypothetical protein
MYVNINVTDELTPALNRLIAEYPKAVNSALKGTGFFAMREVQNGIKSGSPGGSAYAQFMPLNMRRKLNNIMGRSTSSLPLGKMSRAVKYKADSDGSVTVGWLSQSSQRIGNMIEQGLTRNVTDKVRGLYHLAKVNLDKEQIDVPARHTWDPMINYLTPRIPSEFERRFTQKLEKVIK